MHILKWENALLFKCFPVKVTVEDCIIEILKFSDHLGVIIATWRDDWGESVKLRKFWFQSCWVDIKEVTVPSPEYYREETASATVMWMITEIYKGSLS